MKLRGFRWLVLPSASLALACSSPTTGPAQGGIVGSRDGSASTDPIDASRAPDGMETSDAGLPDESADSAPDADPRADAGADDASAPTTVLPSPVCSPSATWGPGTPLGAAVPAGVELGGGAITPDELTVAWTYDAGTTTAVAWADRMAVSVPFSAPQQVMSGSFANDRVALSPDGLRLVAVNADRQGFSELTRPARTGTGSTFGPSSAGSYVNFQAGGALASGQSVGDPVLSASDTAFYYSLYDGMQTTTIYRTARLLPSDPWPVGAPLSAQPELAASGAARRRPTAISSDDQTLFFWDEILGIERAAWIDPTTGTFDTFLDLGMRQGAGPNAPCNRLYYWLPDAGASPIFVSSS